MGENGICSRETVLNHLLDRYKTTYEDMAARFGSEDPVRTISFMEDCTDFFTDVDASYEERVRNVLDRICRFYEADAAYFLLYGRSRSIYCSHRLGDDSEDAKNRPTASEFSLLLLDRLKSAFKPGRLCFLQDTEHVRDGDREVYNKLKSVGVKNEVFMPVFSFGNVVGFLTIYNIRGGFTGLSHVGKQMNVIATLGNELEASNYKNLQLARKLVGENTDNYMAEARKSGATLQLANEVSRRLGGCYKQAFVINLETGDYAEKEINAFCFGDENKTGVTEDFERMAEELIRPEYKAGLKRFLLISDLNMRLRERDKTEYEYVDNDGHWCRCAFRLLGRDEYGKSDYVLFSEEIIDGEKSSSQAQMHFLSTVSELYLAVYRLDLSSVGVLAVKPFETGRRFEEFSANLQQMIDVWSAEFMYLDSTDEERAFLNMSTLAERLRDENKISIDINSSKLGWIRLEFIAYSRGTDGEVKSVLWMVKSIIDEKRYEALNKAISETYMVMAFVSIPHNRYKTLIYSHKAVRVLPEESTLETALSFLRLNACEEHRSAVMEFADPTTITERMGNEKMIVHDYINSEGHWSRLSLAEAERDRNGRISNLVFAIQMIDDVKRKELEKEAAAEWAYEEAKQANSAKSGFFSNLSHDIRTPMNAIVGMTRIAMENIDDRGRLEDCLEKIKSSSDHLLALINDSLDLSRIESGKIVIAHESVNLREMESNFMSIMQGYMVDRKLEIITDCQPLAVDYVLTDGLRLRQVVLNILSNAVKYTPDGKNIVYRTENKLSPDGKHLHIKYTIADSGIGMTQEFLEKIYEPFSRVEKDGAQSKYKGTGLGMLIVKNFVDMLGGKIEIQSELNVGTVVTLTFDFDVDPDPVAHVPSTVSKQTKKLSVKNAKILLVEDNDINREIAIELLKEMGFDITEAFDGEDAVYKFRSSAIGEYKCILMDIMMPVMNGYEATKAIRSLHRDDAKKVPIIAMTANAFMEDIKTSKECGMNEHISKPIDPNVVKEILERFVAG